MAIILTGGLVVRGRLKLHFKLSRAERQRKLSESDHGDTRLARNCPYVAVVRVNVGRLRYFDNCNYLAIIFELRPGCDRTSLLASCVQVACGARKSCCANGSLKVLGEGSTSHVS